MRSTNWLLRTVLALSVLAKILVDVAKGCTPQWTLYAVTPNNAYLTNDCIRVSLSAIDSAIRAHHTADENAALTLRHDFNYYLNAWEVYWNYSQSDVAVVYYSGPAGEACLDTNFAALAGPVACSGAIVQAYKAVGESKCLTCDGLASNATPSVGDPIDIGTGNSFEKVTDFTTAGSNPLGFTRYYNSFANTDAQAAMLGSHWRSSFERYLRIASTNGQPISVVAERADGRELAFTTNSNGWISDSDVDLDMVQSGTSWAVTDSDDTVETYSTINPALARLDIIRARNGYTQTLQYDASNHLVSVTDSFGRSLQFNYQGNLVHTLTAPDGLVVTFGYDSSSSGAGVASRLVSVGYSTTPPTGLKYLYEVSNLPFALTGIVDENGDRYATSTYDSTGRALSSQHGNGADLTTVAYNDSDGSRTVTNPLGLQTVYTFATLQGVQKAGEMHRLATPLVPAGNADQGYDGNGFVGSRFDWNTNLTSYSNDPRGQVLNIDEAVGTPQNRATSFIYHPRFHLPTTIDAPLMTRVLTYDTNGNVLSRTDRNRVSVGFMSRTWTFTYGDFGEVLTATGPRPDVPQTSSYGYDASGNVNNITNALGHVTRIPSYNQRGLPLVLIDPNGVTNSFTYDTRGRLLSRTVKGHAGNAVTAFGYDAAGELTSIALPDGSRLGYQYDTAHRLISVTNSLGESIGYTLDAAGNITRQDVHNPDGTIAKTQRRVFDELSRPLKEIGASGQTVSYGYDDNGNPLSVQDSLTNKTTQVFDVLNRLVAVYAPLNTITGYTLDPQDNLTSVYDPRQITTSYSFDGIGDETQEDSADFGGGYYKVDEAGNRIQVRDPRDVIENRTFDALSRLTAKRFPASPGENITFSYDSTNGGNFGIGRLTGYFDETGSTTIIYDERGNVVSTTRQIDGQSYNTTYEYDLADHVTRIGYPSGRSVAYGHDTEGRINSVTLRASASGAVTVLANNVTYRPFGPLSHLVFGNGLALTRNYDQDYRVTNIDTGSVGSQVQDTGFGYDSVNDITAITDQLDQARSQTFGYDANYRLTQAAGIYGTISYAYDHDGNRTLEIANGVTNTYAYADNANHLLSVIGTDTRNFKYTPLGNVASDSRSSSPSYGYSYGNRNRLSFVTINNLAVASYRYNALGERLVKTVGQTVTHYHFDGRHHHIAESDGTTGAMLREYIWLDDIPLAQIEADGTVYYIHPDHLNTPQKMTDSGGSVVWDRVQMPFGETFSIASDVSAPASATLSALGFNASGQFGFTVTGTGGANYMIQVTTNLGAANWESIRTNSAPFVFTDSSGQNSGTRFYRAVAILSSGASGVTQNLRFPGQYYDAETGLHYNLMRDYDPTLGRYPEADPIGLGGGQNVYEYVNSRPAITFDPLGTTLLYSATPFPGQAGNQFGPYIENIADGSPLVKPLHSLDSKELCSNEMATYNKLPDRVDFVRDISDEAIFDTRYRTGDDPNDNQYYLYLGVVYSGNEINYYGIGMYEARLGDTLWTANRITELWKLQYFELPSSGTYYWLAKGFNDYRNVIQSVRR